MATSSCRRWLKGTNPITVGQALIQALPTLGIWGTWLLQRQAKQTRKVTLQAVLNLSHGRSVSPFATP